MEKLLIEYEINCGSTLCENCKYCKIYEIFSPINGENQCHRYSAKCSLFKVNLEFLPRFVYRHNDCLAASRRWRDLALPGD